MEIELTIDLLTPAAAPTLTHQIPSQKDGKTEVLTVEQILDLYNLGAAINESTAATDVADTDKLVIAADGAKKVTFAALISSIFKTARTIANARFASASFKLFNNAGTPRSLSFVTTALSADRTITVPDVNVDLSNIVPPDVKAWVNFNGTGTVAIRASKNVSSITDNGVGDYTINFSNALADANYATVAMASGDAGSNGYVQKHRADITPQTTTSVRIAALNTSAALYDPIQISAIITR